MQLKSCGIAEDTLDKGHVLQEWERLLFNYLSDRVLISKIYKELQKTRYITTAQHSKKMGVALNRENVKAQKHLNAQYSWPVVKCKSNYLDCW